MAEHTDKRYHLVSERSPSYERAREERLNPSPAPEPTLVAKLIVATHTEQDVADSYDEVRSHPNAPTSAAMRGAQHRDRASLLRILLEKLGASAGPTSDTTGSMLRVEFGDTSYDTTTDALEQLFDEAESTLDAIYADLAESEMPEWLRSELTERLPGKSGGSGHVIKPHRL